MYLHRWKRISCSAATTGMPCTSSPTATSRISALDMMLGTVSGQKRIQMLVQHTVPDLLNPPVQERNSLLLLQEG